MSDMTILLSIIVPIYNAEIYILNFMKNYDLFFRDQIELILVDDGSTDKTIDLLKQYSEVKGVRIILSKHNGSASARNIGLKVSKGEYVIFSDIDDFLDISLALMLTKSMVTNNISILKNKYEVTSSPNNALTENSSATFDFTHFQTHRILECMGFWTYIFKKDILIENELLFWPTLKDIRSKYFVLDDWFFLMSLLRSQIQIFESNIVIYNYYVNLSEIKKSKYINQQKELLKCYFFILKSKKLRKNYYSRATWRYVALDIARSIYFNVSHFKCYKFN